MTRLANPLARGLAGLVLVAGCSLTLACNKVTMISSESPIQVQAKPPAAPLADLPLVPQPPPPARVKLEGELLWLDEPLTFDEAGKLSTEHEDILAEVAKWLAHNPDMQLSVEVQSTGKGSKRTHQKRSKELATQIVDALVREGIDTERLIAASVGASPDDQRHVALRVSKRAGEDSGFTMEE